MRRALSKSMGIIKLEINAHTHTRYLSFDIGKSAPEFQWIASVQNKTKIIKKWNQRMHVHSIYSHNFMPCPQISAAIAKAFRYTIATMCAPCTANIIRFILLQLRSTEISFFGGQYSNWTGCLWPNKKPFQIWKSELCVCVAVGVANYQRTWLLKLKLKVYGKDT